ncbi:hypothetical protein ABPG72_018915 [Tetrahymena utriculariae]
MKTVGISTNLKLNKSKSKIKEKNKLGRMKEASKILSTRRKQFSRVKINEKFYLQISNKLEKELIQNEKSGKKNDILKSIEYFEYPFQVEVIEKEDGSVKFKSLTQLVKLIKYFKLKQNVTKQIVRNYLGLKEFYQSNFQKFTNLEKSLKLIISYSQKQIDNFFSNYYPDKVMQETLQKEYELNNFENQFHKSIFQIQFLPCDFFEVEQNLISSKTNLITNKQKQDFLIWKQFLQVKGTRNINVFLDKYNLKEEKYTETAQIQEFIDKTTNNYYLDNNVGFFKPLKGKSQKIVVEMRDVNGKMRLATKNSYYKHLNYLFKPTSSNNNLNNAVITNYQQKINQLQPLLCFYIDIKDLSQNISYKLIKDLKLYKIEKYLLSRKVYHFDIKSNKKVPLDVKKGIFIGEVFTPYVINKVCNLLKQVIQNSFLKTLKNQKILLHNIQIYKFQDDYFIKVFDSEQVLYTSQKVVNYLQKFEDPSLSEQILQDVKSELATVGFEYNQQKVRVLYQRQKKRKLWSLNSEGKLTDCDNFEVFKQNILDINHVAQENQKEYQEFINNQLQKYRSNPNFIQSYSELELFALQKMVHRILKFSDDQGVISELSFLKKDILCRLNLSTWQANYSSYNQY